MKLDHSYHRFIVTRFVAVFIFLFCEFSGRRIYVSRHCLRGHVTPYLSRRFVF